MSGHDAATLVVLLAGLPVAVCCGYLVSLAVASVFHRPHRADAVPHSRLAVVVPAHDEAEMIEACVHSLTRQHYPTSLFRVVVVADNCTDDTAAIAAAAGAEVMVRNVDDLRGKGHALRWAFDRLLAEQEPPDAVVVVDADAIADPMFLREMGAVFSAGNPVVQGDDVLSTEPGDRRALLEAAGLVLRNRVRFAGRAVFGLPAVLCGNGMLLARSVLQVHPWQAFTGTEDGEYALGLLQAGLATAFAQRARVLAAATAGGQGAYTQSLRWDGGRITLARTWAPRLLARGLRQRDPLRLSTAWDLAMPPLGALVMAATGGSVVAVVLALMGIVGLPAAIPWLLAAIALPVYVAVGLASSHVPVQTYSALLLAPLFLARKLRVYARLLRGTGGAWVRTQRPAEARANPGPR